MNRCDACLKRPERLQEWVERIYSPKKRTVSFTASSIIPDFASSMDQYSCRARSSCAECFEAQRPPSDKHWEEVCECGADGVERAQDRPGAICSACALAMLREDLEKWRSALTAIMKAVGGDKIGPYTVDRVGEILAERIEALKAHKPTLEEAQAVIVAEIDRLVAEPTQDLRQRTTAWGATCVGESGPGLAAKHPDATPAAKMEQPTITTDLGADWE